MNQTLNLASLAVAQAIPPDHADGITLRYDASIDGDGDPVVYAVIESSDLCKLPIDVLSGLGIGADRQDQIGDSVFFVGDDASLRLLVDTDVFPSFKADLEDITSDHGITLYNAQGDLHALCGPDGDIIVPNMPAFVHAGMGRIATDVALAMLTEERLEMTARLTTSNGKDDDNGFGPQLC